MSMEKEWNNPIQMLSNTIKCLLIKDIQVLNATLDIVIIMEKELNNPIQMLSNSIECLLIKDIKEPSIK